MLGDESLLGIVDYLRAGTNKLASPNHVIRRECSHSNTPTHERPGCGENESNRNRQLELILKKLLGFRISGAVLQPVEEMNVWWPFYMDQSENRKSRWLQMPEMNVLQPLNRNERSAAVLQPF